MEVKDCPVCGAKSFKEVFKAPFFRGDGELFAIKECTSCAFWVTSPRPNDEDLGVYYEAGNYISHTSKKESLIDHLYVAVRNYSLKRKLSLINKVNKGVGDLLDYGAGTGHFLTVAKSAGWKTEGVEISGDARAVAEKENKLSLVSPEEFKWSSTYDVVSMWHVLEHLPGLNEHLAKFSKALNKNGALVVAVPNHESYDAKVYGESWAALDVPLHLYHFKKNNVEKLALKHGLVMEAVHNMPFDSFYVSMLSEKVATGKGNIIRAFFRGWQSNRKGRKAKNMSSLIYILRKSN